MADRTGGHKVFQQAESALARGCPCSQSLLQALQETLGLPADLIRAAAAVGNGRAGTCGLLVGGLLALGYAATRQPPQPDAPPSTEWLDVIAPTGDRVLHRRCLELRQWFEQLALSRYGGVDCRAISGADWGASPATRFLAARHERCQALLQETVSRLLTLLDVEAAATA